MLILGRNIQYTQKLDYKQTRNGVLCRVIFHLDHCNESHLRDEKTRSQAVARIADRTVSHIRGSRDVIGHVFDSPCHAIGGPLERSLQIQPFSRYCALSVLGSRVLPFKVT